MTVNFRQFVTPPTPGSQPFDPISQALQAVIGQGLKERNMQLAAEHKSLLAQQEEAREQAIVDAERASLARGFHLNKIGQITDPIEKRRAIATMGQEIADNGGDPSLFVNMLGIADDDEFHLALTQQAVSDLVAGGGEDFADELINPDVDEVHSSAVTEILDDGTIVEVRSDGSKRVTDPEGNVVTGAAAAAAIKEANRVAIDRKTELAQIEIGKQRDIDTNKARIKRHSTIKGELSERNRTASRGMGKVQEALTLAANATQGTMGQVKLQISKLFPDIDVSSDAALQANLINLAMDELQKFKGPTTDFEFLKVQEVAGRQSDAKSSNIAKLKALQRAKWYMQDEFRQFKAFKGDPDEFSYDFDAKMTFGKKEPRQYTMLQLRNAAAENNLTMPELFARLEAINK